MKIFQDLRWRRASESSPDSKRCALESAARPLSLEDLPQGLLLEILSRLPVRGERDWPKPPDWSSSLQGLSDLIRVTAVSKTLRAAALMVPALHVEACQLGSNPVLEPNTGLLWPTKCRREYANFIRCQQDIRHLSVFHNSLDGDFALTDQAGKISFSLELRRSLRSLLVCQCDVDLGDLAWSCERLTSLSIHNCHLADPQVPLPTPCNDGPLAGLRRLHLSVMNLTSAQVEQIVALCPVLEEASIWRLPGVRSLCVSSPSLRVFAMTHCGDRVGYLTHHSLTLHCPQLHTLEVGGRKLPNGAAHFHLHSLPPSLETLVLRAQTTELSVEPEPKFPLRHLVVDELLMPLQLAAILAAVGPVAELHLTRPLYSDTHFISSATWAADCHKASVCWTEAFVSVHRLKISLPRNVYFTHRMGEEPAWYWAAVLPPLVSLFSCLQSLQILAPQPYQLAPGEPCYFSLSQELHAPYINPNSHFIPNPSPIIAACFQLQAHFPHLHFAFPWHIHQIPLASLQWQHCRGYLSLPPIAARMNDTLYSKRSADPAPWNLSWTAQHETVGGFCAVPLFQIREIPYAHSQQIGQGAVLRARGRLPTVKPAELLWQGLRYALLLCPVVVGLLAVLLQLRLPRVQLGSPEV